MHRIAHKRHRLETRVIVDGLVPLTRGQVFERIKRLENDQMSFREPSRKDRRSLGPGTDR